MLDVGEGIVVLSGASSPSRLNLEPSRPSRF